jgi:hypothetical protein
MGVKGLWELLSAAGRYGHRYASACVGGARVLMQRVCPVSVRENAAAPCGAAASQPGGNHALTLAHPAWCQPICPSVARAG